METASQEGSPLDASHPLARRLESPPKQFLIQAQQANGTLCVFQVKWGTNARNPGAGMS
jgi:hypothetical protein